MTKFKQAQRKAKIVKVAFYSVVGIIFTSAIAVSVYSWVIELSNQGVL